MIQLGETWSKLLNAFAAEIAIFEEAVANLVDESVPGLAVDLITDWENMLGLPDECDELASTLSGRQAVAHAKYTASYSGLSKNFFIAYAASLGSSITVVEQFGGGTPFRVNNGRVTRTPEDGIDGARLWSLGVYHEWEVQISSTDPNKDYLNCYFNKIKPAHTQLVWTEV